MIALYTCNIDRIRANRHVLIGQVARKRKETVFAYKRERDRLLCLAAGLLLAKVLGKDCEDSFLYNAYGKPFLPEDGYFNLSHAGKYAVLAVSDSLIGVDIEEQVQADFTALAKTAFHPDEIKLMALAEDKMQAFYALWTLKESYIKYLGTGFSLEPTSFAISLTESNACLMKAPGCAELSLPAGYPRQEASSRSVNFVQPPVCPGYALSICCQKYEVPSINEILF